MKAHTIDNLKGALHALLSEDAFDHFELAELTVATRIRFHIDGRMAENSSTEHYIKYSEIRPILFQILRDPDELRTLKLVLFHSAAEQDVISGGFLNLLYQDGKFMSTSAVSYKTFTPDKSFEDAWDAYITKLLTTHGLL